MIVVDYVAISRKKNKHQRHILVVEYKINKNDTVTMNCVKYDWYVRGYKAKPILVYHPYLTNTSLKLFRKNYKVKTGKYNIEPSNFKGTLSLNLINQK